MEEYAVQTTDIQTMSPEIGIWAIVIWVVLYLFFAYCLALVAKKTGRPFGESLIMAIIPIANIILVLQIAGKPWWWIFLLLIPIVNLVLWIIAWMKIAEARGKAGWWGIVIVLVPIVGLILFLILAFGKEGTATPAPVAA